jgi:hypothetical protein
MHMYVQEFARRWPAAFLLGCAAAGFAAATVLITAVSSTWSATSRALRGRQAD